MFTSEQILFFLTKYAYCLSTLIGLYWSFYQSHISDITIFYFYILSIYVLSMILHFDCCVILRNQITLASYYITSLCIGIGKILCFQFIVLDHISYTLLFINMFLHCWFDIVMTVGLYHENIPYIDEFEWIE